MESRSSHPIRSERRILCLVIASWVVLGVAAAGVAGGAETPSEAAAPPEWEARLAAGFSLHGGDENEFGLSGDTQISRLWTVDKLTLRGLADWSKTGGETKTENYSGLLSWRHGITERFFWLSSTGVGSDPVQGRSLRVTAGSGPGYRIWQESEKEFFDFATGLGYRHERYRYDEPSKDFVDLRAGYDYQDMIGDILEIVHSSEVYAPANDFNNFLGKSELTLSIPLMGKLHFRNNARYEYVNDPADDKKKSNYWVTMGLEYRL